MLARLLIFNSHAGSGIGEIMAAICIAAIFFSVLIFIYVYRLRPSAWLRIVGSVYFVSVVSIVTASAIWFGALLLLLAPISLGGFLFALALLVASLTFRRKPSQR